MDIFLIILIILLILATMITAVGYAMSPKINFSESIVIHKSADEIYKYIADFEEFVKWSPWSEKDPEMVQNFEGECMSFGHKYIWKGNSKVGTGSMEITHLEVNRKVDILLNFGNRGNSQTSFILHPDNGTTRVEWVFDTDLGKSPASRLFGPLMRKFIRKDFQHGLQNLKRLNEQ
ncbi:MAG: SRPBCC family protein [Bacteroidota bacterium]|jgi:hypothetical protein